MKFKEHFKSAVLFGKISIATTIIIWIAKLILLIRMNAQQCIPEVSMFDYFGVVNKIYHFLIFVVGGFCIPMVIDYIRSFKFYLPTIDTPFWIQKAVEYLGIFSLFALALFIICFYIYTVFIKTPC